MLLKLARRVLHFLPPDLANRIRASLIRTQAGLHRISFANVPEPQGGWPILLQISVLKSGTHLLDQILTGFSRVSPFSPRALYLKSYDHKTGILYDADVVVHALSNYRPLEIIKAHLFSDPILIEHVSTHNYLTYFIYRDPRDVIVSFAYYGFVEANPDTRLMFQSLSMQERIRHLIIGAHFGQFHFEGINTFYRRFIDWVDCPVILRLRYEDLIHRRQAVLQQITDHFLFRIDTLPVSREQVTRALESNIDPKKSPTFRRGTTGDWKSHFTVEHKNLFKEHTSDLLTQLGYEQNNDW
jgi:sulfotransferase 6B1